MPFVTSIEERGAGFVYAGLCPPPISLQEYAPHHAPLSKRGILKAKHPEPGGVSRWKPKGNRAERP